MHAMMGELPFDGLSASGMGAYHGATGFHTFSHCKGIFLNLLWLLRPPFSHGG